MVLAYSTPLLYSTIFQTIFQDCHYSKLQLLQVEKVLAVIVEEHAPKGAEANCPAKYYVILIVPKQLKYKLGHRLLMKKCKEANANAKANHPVIKAL